VHSFDKTRRLLTKADYSYVFEQPEKILTSDFVFLYRKNAFGFARIGLALSKKKVAEATQRNRLKRLLRESFRVHNLPSVDMVILARTGLAQKENNLIIERLKSAWNKLIACCAI
jgi:ribonuclease P protein component